jgi:methyl-accepting chemotaxis protein
MSGFFAYHGIWAPGVRLFRTLGFSTKASIISLAFVVPFLGLILWQLDNQATDALLAREDATRQHVEVAYGVLVAAHQQEVAGKLSRDQAQVLAKQTIAQMRYDGQEYFWINDLRPHVLMHPIKPDLDGKDASGIKDPNGRSSRPSRTRCARAARALWPTSGPSLAATSRSTRSPMCRASSPGAG